MRDGRGESAFDVAEAVALYLDGRETVSSLARRYGVHYRTMRRALAEEGVVIVNPKARKEPVVRRHRTCLVCVRAKVPEKHDRVPSDADGRVCSECNEYKSWANYYENAKGHKGYSSACRTCHGVRVAALRRRAAGESAPRS